MIKDWTKLNAYMDGELDPAAAAEVAAAIAASPDLAARVASLSRLKAGLAAGDVLAPVLPAPPKPPLRRRLAPAAAAALFLLAAATAGFAAWHHVTLPNTAAELSQAGAMHRAWLAQPGGPDKEMQTALVQAPGPASRMAPDLREARLSLVYKATNAGKTGAVFFGYQGIHGCRVGLWIGKAGVHADNSLGQAPQPRQSGELAAFAWHAQGSDFVLLAHGMPAARLGRLAELTAEIIARNHRLDEGLRLALRETTAMAPPCA